MDVLTFLANIIKSVSWPIVATIAIIVFRAPISQVISSLKGLKYREVELTFGKELAKLKTNIDQVPLPQIKETRKELAQSTPSDLQSQIEQIALISPASAVALAWTGIESELQEVAKRLALLPDQPRQLSAVHYIDALLDRKLIDVEICSIVHHMRDLRNEAAHSIPNETGISVENAIEYGQLTDRVIEVLKSLEP